MLWVCSARLWEREDAGTSLGAWEQSDSDLAALPQPRPEGYKVGDNPDLARASAPARATTHSATRPSIKSIGGDSSGWCGEWPGGGVCPSHPLGPGGSSKPPALWTPCPEHIKGGQGRGRCEAFTVPRASCKGQGPACT